MTFFPRIDLLQLSGRNVDAGLRAPLPKKDNVKNSGSWVLLVEDDPIFAMLFRRFWKAREGAAELVVAKNLEEMSTALRERGEPHLVILDRNLPDGDGHEVARTATWPSHCWSSLGEDATGAKPIGKEALQKAVALLLDRVDCLQSEGRGSRGQE